MIKLRIIEILEEQGKTRYWLNKRMDMHYVNFKKMIENQTDSIHFETLDTLWKCFNANFFPKEKSDSSI